MNKPQYILIHTVDLSRPTEPEEIDGWHVQRGFCRYPGDYEGEVFKPQFKAFAYHHYIRYNGTTTQHRHHQERGSHCPGMNSRSIAICFEGDGDKEDFTREQITAAQELVGRLVAAFPAIDSKRRILGHRERDERKTCPGSLIDMDALRWLLWQGVTSEVR